MRRNFNGDQKSLMQNNGVFFLADTSFGPLNILWGGRYDQFDAKSEETAVGLLGIPFDSSGLQKVTKMLRVITSACLMKWTLG